MVQDRFQPLANLPEEAFREAERYQLGLPLQRYTRNEPFMGMVVLVDVLFIFCLTALTFGHPTSSDNPMLWLCWGVMWLCFAGLVAWATWHLWQFATYAIVYSWKRCYLCTDGLLIIRGSRRVLAAIRWDEIRQIYPQKGMYQIITKENVCVSIPMLGNMRQMKELGEPVCEALRHLFPAD